METLVLREPVVIPFQSFPLFVYGRFIPPPSPLLSLQLWFEVPKVAHVVAVAIGLNVIRLTHFH